MHTTSGDMEARIRAFDWSATPLGAMESWSPALRMMVRFLLANRFPMLLWWGPDYVCIYNDPYRPILGTKHPRALGQPTREVWGEIWHILQPLIDTPFKGGPSTWNEDIGLELNRHGFVEETHFTIAYSPVPDETVDNGIGGVLATVHEITGKIVGERRVIALRDLGARVGDAKSAEEACATAARTLAAHAKDVPFALIYLIDGDRQHARLAGAIGVEPGSNIAPEAISLQVDANSDTGWPIAQVIQEDALRIVSPLGARFASVPAGPWSDPPDTAVVLPIPSNRADEPFGAIVAGVSARLAFDEYYKDFLELVRTQIAIAIGHARAYEEERKRAEALAEIDRAKTAFFSNVSHEFRTPLTLLVGPIEDGLADAQSPLPAVHRERLTIAQRNALRLLRLVNTLLDFSRIEAGRIDASYEPTDLASFTKELASVFRSAVEKAGLALIVECQPLSRPVHVDRDMWEKIVMNLLSNAFKFTFEGEIRVELRDLGDQVELRVSDTGVGIPEADLSRIFERFHRVKDARARTHEGTGIGLALVQELVRLHGGRVTATSREGQGTTFTVTMPIGTAHLPQDRLAAGRHLTSTRVGAAGYVEEALRWLPAAAEPAATEPGRPRAHVLIADDNADMRDYLTRMLGQFYSVETVSDGRTALERIEARRPDLVLTDVMMPQLDGFGLLDAIRGDERTRGLPVILLSARAGEEARIEGLHAGADDYLIKPFSARELLASVASQLRFATVREESERAKGYLAAIVDSADIAILSKDLDGIIQSCNRAGEQLFGYTASELVGQSVRILIPPERQSEEDDILARIRRGERIAHVETMRLTKDGRLIDVALTVSPVRDDAGRVMGASKIVRDITAMKRAEVERVRLLTSVQEASRIKDDFLASLSHELRTPLNAILGYARMLRTGIIAPDKRDKAVDTIERNATSLTQIVEDVLDISRIVSGKLRLNVQSVEFPDIVQGSIDAISPAADARGVRIESVIDPQASPISGDPERLQQILWNLLSNAVKFTNRGGRVQVRLERVNSHVDVTVSDTGIGIAAEFLPHVFERFRQADSSSARAHGGLGLGLAIARQLTEMHGGTIEVSSEGVGKGATFRLQIPLMILHPVRDTEPRVHPGAGRTLTGLTTTDLTGIHVLAVDDEHDALTLVSEVLVAAGARVSTANSAEEAWYLLTSDVPDVLVTDLGMPQVDGFAFIDRVRRHPDPRVRELPAAALTAYARSEDRMRALRAGFHIHLAKPIDPAELVTTMASLAKRFITRPEA